MCATVKGTTRRQPPKVAPRQKNPDELWVLLLGQNMRVAMMRSALYQSVGIVAHFGTLTVVLFTKLGARAP